jgi:hypothetical protein
MKNLARRIKREFGVRTGKRVHCAVYEDELQRIWPLKDKNRQAKIAQFAKEDGFHLGLYKQGLVAIFQREPPRAMRRKIYRNSRTRSGDPLR